MDDLLRNKKIVIVCILIVFVGVISYFIINRDTNTEYIYQDDDRITYLRNYGVNEYIPIYVEESDVVVKYLNDFKNTMISSVEISYNLLNEEYRNKKFGNIEKYREYVNNVLSKSTYSMEVEVYKIIYSNGVKFFDIYDKSGYHYIFKENSIMDYEVYLDNYTIEIK